MKEEQESLFQQKKDHGGSRDWTFDFKVIDQHLSHWATKTCSFQGHHPSIILNLQLAVNMLWLMKVSALCENAPSWRLQSIQAFFTNLVLPSSRFFSSTVAQKTSFLSHDV
jgi:hypothetical protein